MIKVSDKIEIKEKESEIDISEVNTDYEYYEVENVDKLQKVLNDIASDGARASTQKINNVIWKVFDRSKTSYSYQDRSKLNNKYKWSEKFQKQLRRFEKKFVEKLKLIDFETIEIIKEIFVKRNIESNTFTHEFIMKKLIKIMWRLLFMWWHMRTNHQAEV